MSTSPSSGFLTTAYPPYAPCASSISRYGKGQLPARSPPAAGISPCKGGCRHGLPLSSSTQTAELAALRRFYRWAHSEGLRQDDPSQGIRPPRREPYARARGLSAEEMARLLAAIPVESAAGLRLRALVLAYLLTGRRRSEVLNLRWRDLDLEGGFYRQGRQGAAAGAAPSGPAGDSGRRRGGRPGAAAGGGRLPRPLAGPAAGRQVHRRAAAPGSRAGRDPTGAAPAHPASQLRPRPAPGGGATGGRAGRPRSLQPGHHLPSICASWRPGGPLVAQACR